MSSEPQVASRPTAIDPELFRALGALCEAPHPAHARIAAALGLPPLTDPASYTETFVVQLVPYAAVYLGAEGMLGGEAADRVAGFWRALHLTPPSEPDHLGVLLGLYAALADAERAEPQPARRAIRREARRALLWEHLLTWAIAYTTALEDAGDGFYRAWARIVADALLTEADELRPPKTAPACLRAAPDSVTTDEGLDLLVRALLTPVRSGILLSRRDLAEASGSCGLAPRAGERAFMLRSMLEQAPRETLGWLAGHAGRWRARHRATEPRLGPVGVHWRARAEGTRRLLVAARGRA